MIISRRRFIALASAFTIGILSKKVNLNPRDYLFISSHEPCSLCLSAITWSGFDNFIFLFPYEDTKNSFNIPHDLKILKEVFNIKKGKYNRNNMYWKSYSIMQEISRLSEETRSLLNIKIKKIKEIYINLSNLKFSTLNTIL